MILFVRCPQMQQAGALVFALRVRIAVSGLIFADMIPLQLGFEALQECWRQDHTGIKMMEG